MSDPTYQPKVYHKQGGDQVVVADGGEIVVASGGAIEAPEVADVNTQGGIPVVHRIAVADAATGDVDVVLDHKTRIIDAWAVKASGDGGAANSVQVKNGTNAITDDMDINITDTTIVRASTIDDAQHEIAAGGTLKVTRTKAGGNAACIVYVLGLRVA